MKVLKRLGRYCFLLAIVAFVFATPPNPLVVLCSVNANDSSGTGMTCCHFCDQNYENCIIQGGDPVACENLRCSCMVGCGVCPIC